MTSTMSNVSGVPAVATVSIPPAITIPPVPSHTYLHHTTLHPRPKLVLIGDSITEQGSSSYPSRSNDPNRSSRSNNDNDTAPLGGIGWVTALSIRYNRKMDVVNRGMNGYNSKWGREVLPLILEEILGPSTPCTPSTTCTPCTTSECNSGTENEMNGNDENDGIDECGNGENEHSPNAGSMDQSHKRKLPQQCDENSDYHPFCKKKTSEESNLREHENGHAGDRNGRESKDSKESRECKETSGIKSEPVLNQPQTQNNQHNLDPMKDDTKHVLHFENSENAEHQPGKKPNAHTQKYPQYTFIIGYGANDSCLPDGKHSRHHVPLQEYGDNLKFMIQLIRGWSGNCNGKSTDKSDSTDSNNCNLSSRIAVALLTPPPCDTQIQSASRDNERVTIQYANECLRVGREMNVPVVDLWRGMQLPVNAPNTPNTPLPVTTPLESSSNVSNSSNSSNSSYDGWKEDYLSDGLHLTPMGNYRLYQLVLEVLEQERNGRDVENGKAPEAAESLESAEAAGSEGGLGLAVTKLPRQYPDHSMVDAVNLEVTFRLGRTNDDGK